MKGLDIEVKNFVQKFYQSYIAVYRERITLLKIQMGNTEAEYISFFNLNGCTDLYIAYKHVVYYREVLKELNTVNGATAILEYFKECLNMLKETVEETSEVGELNFQNRKIAQTLQLEVGYIVNKVNEMITSWTRNRYEQRD